MGNRHFLKDNILKANDHIKENGQHHRPLGKCKNHKAPPNPSRSSRETKITHAEAVEKMDPCTLLMVM